MGPTRFELVTSSLSGTRSNQLSYEPATRARRRKVVEATWAEDFTAAGAGVNMPDKRHHRGRNPEDDESFAPQWHGPLRSAVADLSWLAVDWRRCQDG